MSFNRRETFLGAGIAAGAGVMALHAGGRAQAAETTQPSKTNLLAARLTGSTIGTPNLELSIRFYRDLLNHDLIRQGLLSPHGVAAPGAHAGQGYAILKGRTAKPVEQGVIRLIEVPAGAKANRPPPKDAIMDPGLVALEYLTRDDEAAFKIVTDAGFGVVSPSMFYHQDGVDPPPGVKAGWDYGDIEVKTFAAIGPGGEMVLMTRGITMGGEAWPKCQDPGLIGGTAAQVLVFRDRWPAFKFYNTALGLSTAKTQYLQQPAVNICIGAPPDIYYYFGSMGQDFGSEWWEFRHLRPPATPPWPTSLERTGMAMMTVTVDDLAAVKSRIQAANIVPEAMGPALPLMSATATDAIYLRGPVGELIEVVGRRA